MNERNQILVEEVVVFELKASSAVLYISVKGTSYFADDVAIKKAKEVSTLVEALVALGISENDIRMTNVVADTQSGIISKSSSAKYFLTAKCRDLDKLSEALSIVTSGKSCELHKLDWQFRPSRATHLEQIAKVFSAARETGECIARALGAEIEGVIDSRYDEFAVSEHERFGAQHMYSKMNVAPSSMDGAPRVGSAPSLPSGQWQKQGIKAKVVFQVGMVNGQKGAMIG